MEKEIREDLEETVEELLKVQNEKRNLMRRERELAGRLIDRVLEEKVRDLLELGLIRFTFPVPRSFYRHYSGAKLLKELLS